MHSQYGLRHAKRIDNLTAKEVTTNDFLNFASLLSKALVENSSEYLRPEDVERLLEPSRHDRFIEETFQGIFFTPDDLRFHAVAGGALDARPGRRAVARIPVPGDQTHCCRDQSEHQAVCDAQAPGPRSPPGSHGPP